MLVFSILEFYECPEDIYIVVLTQL